MSGANAGRAAAGAAGIVSQFVLAQIFICLLLPDTSSMSAEPLPVRLISATGSLMGGAAA